MAMANPFDVLPSNLFNPFGTQGTTLQRHYMAILLRLYGLAEFNRFGLAREIVISEIVDYLRSVDAEQEVAAEMIAAEKAAMRSITGQSHRTRLRRVPAAPPGRDRLDRARAARRLLRDHHPARLCLHLARSSALDSGAETARVHRPAVHGASTDHRQQEQRLFARAGDHAGLRKRAAGRARPERTQSQHPPLHRACHARAQPGRAAATAIRRLRATLGHAYHALKTSDHVSRYRRDIVAQLHTWQRNAEWLTAAADELAAQGRLTPAQAEQKSRLLSAFIIDQLESLDPLLDEIDRRHAQYLRTSLRQIRYQLISADGSFKDRLVSLARRLADAASRGRSRLLPDEMPGPQLQPVRVPDSQQLLHAAAASRAVYHDDRRCARVDAQ